MQIAISSGHGLKVTGARGFIDEVTENRRVADRVAALLRTAGHTVHVFHDNTSGSVAANLNAIVNWHNRCTRDRDVSVHFNAFQTTSNPRGTECLYTSANGQPIATAVSRAMASAGGFINRGPKRRTDLSFLNRTTKPAVLLEVCFVDSRADTDLYKRRFESICRAIAESVGGKAIPGPSQVPGEGPVPEPERHPLEPDVTDNNVVDIQINVTGSVAVSVNDDPITEDVDAPNKLNIFLDHQGDVVVNINGEDFQIEVRGDAVQQDNQ